MSDYVIRSARAGTGTAHEPAKEKCSVFQCVKCKAMVTDERDGDLGRGLNNRYLHIKEQHNATILQKKRGPRSIAMRLQIIQQFFPKSDLATDITVKAEHPHSGCANLFKSPSHCNSEEVPPPPALPLPPRPALPPPPVLPSPPSSYSTDCSICMKSVAPDQREKHVRTVHMQVPRFKCPFCSYEEKWSSKIIQRHISQEHKSEGAPIEVDFDRVEMANYIITCFGWQEISVPQISRKSKSNLKLRSRQTAVTPSLKGPGKNGSKIEGASDCIPCFMCKAGGTPKMVSNKQVCVRSHVLGYHFKKPLFKCPFESCNWETKWTRVSAVNHIRNSHEGSEREPIAFAVDKEKLREYTQLCFGNAVTRVKPEENNQHLLEGRSGPAPDTSSYASDSVKTAREHCAKFAKYVKCSECSANGKPKFVLRIKNSMKRHVKMFHYHEHKKTASPVVLTVDADKIMQLVNLCFMNARTAKKPSLNHGAAIVSKYKKKMGWIPKTENSDEIVSTDGFIEINQKMESAAVELVSLKGNLCVTQVNAANLEKAKKDLELKILERDDIREDVDILQLFSCAGSVAQRVYDCVLEREHSQNACDLLEMIEYYWNNWKVLNVVQDGKPKLYIFSKKLLIQLDDSTPLTFSICINGSINCLNLSSGRCELLEISNSDTKFRDILVEAMNQRVMACQIEKAYIVCDWVIWIARFGGHSFLTAKQVKHPSTFIFHKHMNGFWLAQGPEVVIPFCFGVDKSA